jgi:hypothetical protein
MRQKSDSGKLLRRTCLPEEEIDLWIDRLKRSERPKTNKTEIGDEAYRHYHSGFKHHGVFIFATCAFARSRVRMA